MQSIIESSQQLPQLSTVNNLPDCFPKAGLTEPAIRQHIFDAAPRIDSKGRKIIGNGLGETGAIIRIGRKVLIDVEKYGVWLTRGNAGGCNDK